MTRYRSHNCSELTKNHVGQTVKLAGWSIGKEIMVVLSLLTCVITLVLHSLWLILTIPHSLR